MKTTLLYVLTCCLLLPDNESKAQNIIHLSGTDHFFISAGTTLSLDSLVLVPSANYTVTGVNDLNKSAAVVHQRNNDYIKRVYRFINPFPAFTGTITIYYGESERNYLFENSLTLSIHNGSSWNTYNTGVTRNTTANFVTTSGLSNLNLSELTLTGDIAPLSPPGANAAALPATESSMDKKMLSNITVYPNPAITMINIVADKGGELKSIKVYSGTGALITTSALYKTSKYSLNVSHFSPGVYNVVIMLSDGRSITKAFLKQ